MRDVERPWQRSGFRHPDLMVWVRANRARLVAACLTLGRAWIAAGRPRGTRTIGSYESWAQIMGGVLEVAGIEGFLGNIDEMMEASDSEGAVWRSFVSAWWDRFGTAEVGTGDLFDLAGQLRAAAAAGIGQREIATHPARQGARARCATACSTSTASRCASSCSASRIRPSGGSSVSEGGDRRGPVCSTSRGTFGLRGER